MTTNCSWVSNRLARMAFAYLRAAFTATILLASCPVAQADTRDLCVLVPHFKDEYWLSVAHGIELRAKARGLEVRFFEAGGYRALPLQLKQLADCGDLRPGAILIGAVSSDAPELLAAVATAAAQQPVIGLVNALHSDALAARVGVDWTEMGRKLGTHLATRHPDGSPALRAVLLSGPEESGWVAPLEAGLQRGLAGSAITLAETWRADTGTTEQLRLLEHVLITPPRPDLVIGPAPAIEAAMGVFFDDPAPPLLAATYVSHSVARGLASGRVIAAPFDDPEQQGEMAVDAAVAAMAGAIRPAMIGPTITVLTTDLDAAALKLSPVHYFPTLE